MASHDGGWIDAPNVVADGGLRELGAIWEARVWVARDGGSSSVRRTEDVGAEDEESIRVKRLSATHQWTPPGMSI